MARAVTSPDASTLAVAVSLTDHKNCTPGNTAPSPSRAIAATRTVSLIVTVSVAPACASEIDSTVRSASMSTVELAVAGAPCSLAVTVSRKAPTPRVTISPELSTRAMLVSLLCQFNRAFVIVLPSAAVTIAVTRDESPAGSVSDCALMTTPAIVLVPDEPGGVTPESFPHATRAIVSTLKKHGTRMNSSDDLRCIYQPQVMARQSPVNFPLL